MLDAPMIPAPTIIPPARVPTSGAVKAASATPAVTVRNPAVELMKLSKPAPCVGTCNAAPASGTSIAADSMSATWVPPLARAHQRRSQLVLRLRDATKLSSFAEQQGLSIDWPAITSALGDIRRSLRRRLTKADIDHFSDQLNPIEQFLAATFALHQTDPLSDSDAHIERHCQNSEEEYLESCQDRNLARPDSSEPRCSESSNTIDRIMPRGKELHLGQVLKACPDILPYAENGLRNWPDLVAAAGRVRRMMGISATAWEEALAAMGPLSAAITLVAILQRFTAIRNPGGYLRSLSKQAVVGAFWPGPMIQALLPEAES